MYARRYEFKRAAEILREAQRDGTRAGDAAAIAFLTILGRFV
jgi:hypothetical protein